MNSRIMAAFLALSFLSACELPDNSDRSKVAVKIGQQVVTEVEIEHALKSIPSANAEKEKLKSTVIEALVTQKLLAQAAQQAGLDKKNEVMLDAATAQRQVLAKAYAETLPGMNTAPSDEMVQEFYNQQPNLFSNRRIYRLQEIHIESGPEKLAAIQEQLGKSASLDEFVKWLNAEGLKGSVAAGVKSSEQMSAGMRDRLASMQAGQVVVMPSATSLTVLSIAGIQPQPMTLEEASPAIKKILLEKKQKEALEKEIQRLRSETKIEYAEGYSPPALTDEKKN